MLREFARRHARSISLLLLLIVLSVSVSGLAGSAQGQSPTPPVEPDWVGPVSRLTVSAAGQAPGSVRLTWVPAQNAQVHFVMYTRAEEAAAGNYVNAEMAPFYGTEGVVGSLDGGTEYQFIAIGMRWNWQNFGTVWGEWSEWVSATPSASESGPGLLSCPGDPSHVPLAGPEADPIKAALAGRSFRQFVPHVDGDPRKGVILDFFNGFSLWAQYAEGAYAIHEWEIVADDYSIVRNGAGPGSVVTLHPVDPRTSRQIPAECQDCVVVSCVSVSVRDVFDPDRIAFRVNDPNRVLPSPFPVFSEWTRFREDVYVD